MSKNIYDFGWAIKELKNGNKLGRLGWNGKNMYIKLQRPDKDSKRKRAYIFMETAKFSLIPWLPTQADMLADDWRIHLES